MTQPEIEYIPCEMCQELVSFEQYSAHIAACSSRSRPLPVNSRIRIGYTPFRMSQQRIGLNSSAPVSSPRPNPSLSSFHQLIHNFIANLNSPQSFSSEVNEVEGEEDSPGHETEHGDEHQDEHQEETSSSPTTRSVPPHTTVSGIDRIVGLIASIYRSDQENAEHPTTLEEEVVPPNLERSLQDMLHTVFQSGVDPTLLGQVTDYGGVPIVSQDSYQNLLRLAESIGKVEVGISDINQVSKLRGARNTFCTICQEESQRPKVRELICGHSFCPDCIEKWLEKNVKCPVCMINLQDLKLKYKD